MNKYRCTKGISFIEMCIIVTVVALLAVMAVPAFQQIKMQEQKRKILTNLEYIVTIAQQYIIAENLDAVTYDELVDNNYMSAIPSITGENYSGILINKNNGVIQLIYDQKMIIYQYGTHDLQ